jgi:hypothetical protein
MYTAGTIFVDAASGRIKVKFQRGYSAQETLQSKMEFEREALSHGVTVKSYRTDNGTFTAQAVIDQIQKLGQTISFSGAGAQHQNGVAERAIKTVCEATRTVMLHAALRWPDAYDPSLWPMAMQYVVDILNELPRGNLTVSPAEIFSQSIGSHSRLLNARAWGCPVYVLEPKLRDDGKIPKWSPRTRRGQFLGFSPVHSSTVGLVRNLRTGSITPQFHCVYDSEFETTFAPHDTPPDNWEQLTIEHRYQTPLDEDVSISLSEEWLSPNELAGRRDAIATKTTVRLPTPTVPSPVVPPAPLPPVLRPSSYPPAPPAAPPPDPPDDPDPDFPFADMPDVEPDPPHAPVPAVVLTEVSRRNLVVFHVEVK